MVKHDDWRSAAPFFEVVAAKLQGPSPRPETLAWPPNYHYGGSPFRARGPLLGTKLLGRGPARSPFNFLAYLHLLLLLLLLTASLLSDASSCALTLFLSSGQSTHEYLLRPLPVLFDPANVYQYFRGRPASETALFRGIIEAELNATETPRWTGRLIGQEIALSQSVSATTCWSEAGRPGMRKLRLSIESSSASRGKFLIRTLTCTSLRVVFLFFKRV